MKNLINSKDCSESSILISVLAGFLTLVYLVSAPHWMQENPRKCSCPPKRLPI